MGLHQRQIALESVKSVDWKDKEILDIGCSNGELSLEIMNATGAAKLVGVDIDIERIKKANELANSTKNKDIFFVASADDLNQFPDNSFDGIFCNMAFQQFNDFEKSLKEIKRVLKPGGEAIINFNQEKSPIYFQQEIIYNKLFGVPNKIVSAKKRLDSKTFAQIAKLVGFSNIKVNLINHTYYYKDFEEMANETTFFAKIYSLSEGQKQKINVALKKYLESTKTSKGIPETWKIVFAKLQK